jgi:hypothetical protein
MSHGALDTTTTWFLLVAIGTMDKEDHVLRHQGPMWQSVGCATSIHTYP